MVTSNLTGNGNDGDLLGLVALGVVALAEAPVRVARWGSYVAKRRRDWSVVVRRTSPGPAVVVLDEVQPDKQAAADRALSLMKAVKDGRSLE